VIVLFTIAPAGDVHQVRILKSLPILGEVCAEAVKRWKFAPYSYEARPVSLRVIQKFFFPPERFRRTGVTAP
jgi:TonB family protein